MSESANDMPSTILNDAHLERLHDNPSPAAEVLIDLMAAGRIDLDWPSWADYPIGGRLTSSFQHMR